jgi:hypothetical protein
MTGVSKDYLKSCKTLSVECANGHLLQKACTSLAFLTHVRTDGRTDGHSMTQDFTVGILKTPKIL